jgi:hypothetical protein
MTRETTTPNETIQIPVAAQAYNFQINWGETGAVRNEESFVMSTPVVSHTYAQP